MHSSIAKAQVKGTFRVANDVLDKYNAQAEKRVGQNKPFSRKSMTAYVQNIFDMYGDLLLFHRIDKQNSSWHFDSLNLAINPDPADFGELGAYFGESDRSFRFYPITFSSSFSSLPVLP